MSSETAQATNASRPGRVTSIGALVALGLGAFNWVQQNGGQIEAQRRTDAAEMRLQSDIARLADNAQRYRDSSITAREQLRESILIDVRRDIDAHCVKRD